MRRTLLLAAAVTALAAPAWAEGFRTGTAWEGSLFRDAKGQVKSCATAQRFDTGTTLSFALTREKDLFLVLQNSAIDLPKGERVPVAYAVDRGVAYTTQAFVVRDSVVIDLPNTPAVRDLLAGGSWLSIEGTERSEDFSLKGVAESLKALTACIEQPVAAAKPAPPEPRVAAAAPPPPAPVAAEPVAKAESAAGGVQAQIGTYVSDTRAAAEWERLKKRLSPVLDSYDPLYVQQTRSTDGRTLWLVRVGSFADRDEATRFCDEVKAKGHPDCKPILRP